jgi:protein-S-isoprenylcysteine O-methyltransferase Ste14|eukprot:g4591.t1
MFRAASRHVLGRIRLLGRRRYATAEKEAAAGGGLKGAERKPVSPFATFLQGTIGGTVFYGLGCTYEAYGVEYTQTPLPVDVGRVCFSGVALFYAAFLPGSIARRTFSCLAAVFYGAGLSEMRQNRLTKRPEKKAGLDVAKATKDALLGVATTIPFFFVCKNASKFTMRNFLGGVIMVSSAVAAGICNLRPKDAKPFYDRMYEYTRHPDLFFSWMVWASLPALGGGVFSLLFGPVLMLGKLAYVDAPMLDKLGETEHGEGYRKYERTTSGFFPLPKYHKDISEKKLYLPQSALSYDELDTDAIRGAWAVEACTQPAAMQLLFRRGQRGSQVAISKCPPGEKFGSLVFSAEGGARTFRLRCVGKNGERAKFEMEPYLAPTQQGEDEFVNFVTHFPKAWVDADGFLIGRKEMYFIMSGVVDHGKVGKNGVSEDEYLVVIDGDRTDTAYILSRSGDLQSSETGRAEFESIVAELRRRGFQLPTK